MLEARNKLDGLIFSVEQTMKDGGDKFTEEEKSELNAAVEEAKKELDADDEEKFNANRYTYSQKVQPIFQKMYQQAASDAQNAQGGSADSGDTEFHQQ